MNFSKVLRVAQKKTAEQRSLRNRAVLAGLASVIVIVFSTLTGCGTQRGKVADHGDSGLQQVSLDASGKIQTLSTAGPLNAQNAFSQSLGSNGRACIHCHQPSDAWSVTPAHIRERFEASDGLDPIFRPNDGSNCPRDDVSTVETRRDAYSLLLNKGLIRVSMPVPENAEFTLERVDDPYHCATANDLSLYRRPLPSTNLSFLTTVMWDGRESVPGQSIADDLLTQANDATQGHAQATTPLTDQQRHEILDFELGLFTAQIEDNAAGNLNDLGANGGPNFLLSQRFYFGINDPFGLNPTHEPFNSKVFDIYDTWSGLQSHDGRTEARRSGARGQTVFNSRPIAITGVAGLNDVLGQPRFDGFCTTCHDSPNVGNHSLPAPLNIGLVEEAQRTPDMPLYTFRNKMSGETVKVTDPGRALVTGKWVDIGKFKGPILRGLAARAPYFHNGSAATLEDVIDFYENRFHLGLTPQEKSDLVAFLKTL